RAGPDHGRDGACAAAEGGGGGGPRNRGGFPGAAAGARDGRDHGRPRAGEAAGLSEGRPSQPAHGRGGGGEVPRAGGAGADAGDPAAADGRGVVTGHAEDGDRADGADPVGPLRRTRWARRWSKRSRGPTWWTGRPGLSARATWSRCGP